MEYKKLTPEEQETADIMWWWKSRVLDPLILARGEIKDNYSELLTPDEKKVKVKYILDYLESLETFTEENLLEIRKRFRELWLYMKFDVLKEYDVWDRTKKELEKQCINRLIELAKGERFIRKEVEECFEFCYFVVQMEE